jgi:hypothetical protein
VRRTAESAINSKDQLRFELAFELGGELVGQGVESPLYDRVERRHVDGVGQQQSPM